MGRICERLYRHTRPPIRHVPKLNCLTIVSRQLVLFATISTSNYKDGRLGIGLRLSRFINVF